MDIVAHLIMTNIFRCRDSYAEAWQLTKMIII